jgi:hypothetical protein
VQAVDIYQELAGFAGVPIARFPQDGDPSATAALPEDVENHAWRIAIDRRGEQIPFEELFARFLGRVDPSRVRALVIGNWATNSRTETSERVIELLAAAAGRCPALRAVFLGDIDPECFEVSWIQQPDITPLLAAFPLLEELGVKGGGGLRLSPVTHENLRGLSIRTGGLSGEVVRALGASTLPALHTLELCLGSPWYGGDSTVDDFAGILSGAGLPALRRLALADATNANQVATAVAHAPIVAQLEELDLSLGDLDDEGAAALLDGRPLSHLKALDLNHHYITEPFTERLRAAWPTVEINLAVDGTYVHDGVRYIAVAE